MHPTHQKQLDQYKQDATKAIMEGDYSLVKDNKISKKSMNEQEQQQIAEDIDKLLHAIQLLLPLARGYANTHEVESNHTAIETAERIYNYYAGIENEECPVCGVELIHEEGHSHTYE